MALESGGVDTAEEAPGESSEYAAPPAERGVVPAPCCCGKGVLGVEVAATPPGRTGKCAGRIGSDARPRKLELPGAGEA